MHSSTFVKILAAISIFSLLAMETAFGGDNPISVQAVRSDVPPRIDGRLDDEVWKLAQPASAFTQYDPEEGKPASERSEIRVLYDDEAIYFGCMFYDTDPAAIVSRLTRRDNPIESDHASILIDSYHDHQTGYEFTFNAAGVKTDVLQYDDGARSDDSWDPVWYLETAITPRGWSAEIKIPFSILRYRSLRGDSSEIVWGINFVRYISRKQESDRWAFTPKRQTGYISRFGHLLGLMELPAPRKLEILPFVTGKQSYDPATAYRDRTSEFLSDFGLDFKYGLSSNFSVDGTVNPDFGQVEADPAVLNLSTFETFYPEKRPFFIEGTQIIRFSTFGGAFGPGMFYSRRIGRAISEGEVSVPAGGKIVDLPKSVRILGAAKFSGKTNGGLSVGILEGLTQEEKAVVADSLGNRTEQVLEPLAQYTVVRLRQDIFSNSNIGAIFTSVAKESRAPAFTNGYDWGLRLADNTYSVSGFLALSSTMNADNERVTGSAGKLAIEKIAGEHWLWSLSGDYTSNRYNIDDVGFFFSPDDIGSNVSVTYKEDVPAAVVRSYSITPSYHYRDNFEGENLFRNIQCGAQALFANYWGAGASVGSDFGLYDQYETRGNGIYRKPISYSANANLSSDERNAVVISLGQQLAWDEKLKRQYSVDLTVDLRLIPWMEWSVEGQHGKTINEEAWVTNDFGKPIFADRVTDQYNMVLRNTTTFTRELTLQIYTQVFLAKGHYSNFRELVDPYTFSPASQALAPDFNRQSLNTNIVLRWEYSPGSTLYLVWSQARRDESGEFYTSFANDVRETFQLAPSNVLLLKINYWWNI